MHLTTAYFRIFLIFSPLFNIQNIFIIIMMSACQWLTVSVIMSLNTQLGEIDPKEGFRIFLVFLTYAILNFKFITSKE